MLGGSLVRTFATTATVLTALALAGGRSDAAVYNIPVDPTGSINTVVTFTGSLAASQEFDFVLKLNGDFVANPALEISGLVQIDFSNGVSLLADGVSAAVTSDTTEDVVDIGGILGNTTHFRVNVSPADIAPSFALNMLAILDSINGPFSATMSIELPEGVRVVGDVGETPLPGALPLFASGLGLAGYFGWRRKRAQAA